MSLAPRALAIASALLLPVAAAAQQGPPPVGEDRVLRVCADPNNLPFSNRAGDGFENKLAELLARDLGWTLEYTWFPQRMGFIRNTLRGRDPDSNRFKCDLVMGVPAGFELASTTKPYYRSTYALVYVKGKGLDSVTAPEESAPPRARQAEIAQARRGRPDAAVRLASQASPVRSGCSLSASVRGSGALSGRDGREGPGGRHDRRRIRVGADRRLLRQARAVRRAGRGAVQARPGDPVRLSHRHGRALRRTRVEGADRAADRGQPPPDPGDPCCLRRAAVG